MSDKEWREQVKAGDAALVRMPHSTVGYTYTRVKVGRVTKTQIIPCDGTRWLKTTGAKVGQRRVTWTNGPELVEATGDRVDAGERVGLLAWFQLNPVPRDTAADTADLRVLKAFMVQALNIGGEDD